MSEHYCRGSEWRRWELHLHTPNTKKNDQYQGRDENEKWDNFYRSIKDYVGDGEDPLKAICAIAITDYLSIDNYIKVRNDNCLPDCVKRLLPNVELRMKPIGQEAPLNIHCIFSPDIVNQINDRFFSKLKFRFHDNDYGASYSELVRLGRAYDDENNLSETQAYQTGLNQYVISYDMLAEIFTSNKDLKNNTIIIVSNKNNDGASGIVTHSGYFEGTTSQLDATRQQIYQLADMIFSSSSSDIKYFLGKKADNTETVIRKCGSLMPCVHGCDAHTNVDIFEPSEKRY